MKSLNMLWKRVADDLATRCCTSATLDFKTVQARVEHEGISFYTITLLDFAKAFERGLDEESIAPILALNNFQSKKGFPVFLQGFLELVFCRTTGVLLDDPNIDAILAVRQLTLMFGKIFLPCSDARTRKAMKGFVECEREVQEADRRIQGRNLSDFARISDLLFRDVLRELDTRVLFSDHTPKHGPGTTADKLLGNQKFGLSYWPSRLEAIFPYRMFCTPNDRYYYERRSEVDFPEPGAEMPVKVIPVPKTQKTPRIIAIEPTAMQYMQQSIKEMLVEGLQHCKLSPMIGFDDQPLNQRLAQEGSIDRSLATLDLSEASDRVSNELVRKMLAPHPFLHAAVDACRSRSANVPGEGIVRLAKFASMGSALTFPIEAMVFLTLVFLGIERESNIQIDDDDVKRLRRQVRVYGDDIIVPADYVQSVITTLEAFGLKVNVHKSFWSGKFRESCGKEYYNGEDVSIVRLRRMFPTSRLDAAEVISMVSLRNQCYFAGYWGTVKWLDRWIRKIIHYFPTVLPSSPALGRHSFLGYEAEEIDEDLHRPVVKAYVDSSPIPINEIDGSDALLKCLLKTSDLPFADERHLERSGRPSVVNIKLRSGVSAI